MERERTADALANKDLDCARRIADHEAEAARMAEERN